jgi:hypothetical protein
LKINQDAVDCKQAIDMKQEFHLVGKGLVTFFFKTIGRLKPIERPAEEASQKQDLII